jgi:hypothetical protein
MHTNSTKYSSLRFRSDIDDIEDFELDDGGPLEDLLHDDQDNENFDGDDDDDAEAVRAAASARAPAGAVHMNGERERKRGGSFVLVTSPDLAYGSLNPSTGDT